MFITRVDSSLERLLRARLPLPEEIGDISFDPPDATWSAGLSRITVNLFLYDVQRSAMPPRGAVQGGPDRPGMRRRPQPSIQLGYLVSAWAGSARDEHQLLGDVVSILAGTAVLPEEFASPELASSVQLMLGEDPRNANRDIWSAAGGRLKASVVVQAIVSADTFDWEQEAPRVQRVEVLSRPRPGLPGATR